MKRILWSILGYLGIIIVVFRSALVPDKNSLIFGDDIHRAYYFYREFFNIFLQKGIFPWWNPYNFSGAPFIANPIVNIWYPPTWIFVFFPLNIAYSWHLALHVLWAMLGMYFALRAMSNVKCQMSNVSAWIGGVVFGLSGFFMARTWAGHVDVIAGASWIPWVIGLMILLITAKTNWKKYLVFSSFALAMQLYAGYQTMAFFTLEIVGLITLLYTIATKRFTPIFRVGISVTIGLGLGALQLIPEQEFFRNSIRTYAVPYSWNSYGSLTWESLRQLVNPFWFGNQYTYNGPSPNFIEHSMFVGRIGLSLAFMGFLFLIWLLIHRKKQKKIEENHIVLFGWVFIVLAFFGIWIALGSNAPIDAQKILWQLMPMYHYLRIPPRHLILVVFSLSGLVAIGLSKLKNKVFQVAVIALVVGEMIVFARTFIEVKPIPEIRHDPELIRLFTQETQPYRLLQNFGVWLPQRDVLDPDSVMSYGIYSATGYDPSILRSYYNFIAESTGQEGSDAVRITDVQVPYVNSGSAHTLDALNIKYLMVPLDYDPFINNQRYMLLRENIRDAYRVYENTTVLPRFYFKNSGCGTAAITTYTPNKIEVEVEVTCDNTLLSSEVWYPGWHAKVDGKNVPIDKLDGTFRTIIVPLGKHTVVFEYSPLIFYISAGISLVTLCILFLLLRTSKNTLL